MIGFLPRYLLITSTAIAKGISETYAAWLPGSMNGCSIIGRVGIGVLADKRGQVQALAASFILCGLGDVISWLPGVVVSLEIIQGAGTEESECYFRGGAVYSEWFRFACNARRCVYLSKSCRQRPPNYARKLKHKMPSPFREGNDCQAKRDNMTHAVRMIRA